MFVAAVAVEKTKFSFGKLFSYIIPCRLENKLKVGSVVFVPFGASNSLRQGVVLNIEKKKLMAV